MRFMAASLVTCLLVLLTGCKSRPIQIGNVVYHPISSPSLFGPYQKAWVTYEVGNTNAQRLLFNDANAGPGAALLGSAIKAGGFVYGLDQIKPNKENVTVTGGGGATINNNPNLGNQNVTVQAPGSR